MSKNPHLSSAENYFQRHSEFKDYFLALSTFERKCLKWEGKLARLINSKKSGTRLTLLLDDTLASNARVS
jgi:hypothetical protein